MQQITNILRGRPWLLLAALFAWLLPQRVNAEAYVEKPENYSVSLGGSNIVYFTAPVYDQDNADQWITSGKLMCQPEGESQFEVIYWKAAETDISGSATEVSTYFSTPADGFCDITKGNTRETFRLTKNNAGNVKRHHLLLRSRVGGTLQPVRQEADLHLGGEARR